MPLPSLSYAQRYEDLHLWRCFGAEENGFYIDAGAGHPVYDNVSFAFYLAGWRVVVDFMALPFHWQVGPAFAAAVSAVLLTMVFGLIGTWPALGRRPAPVLRNL